MKNIYFDSEFTGLIKDTDLISIGLIADDGKTFYAEFTDYDEAKVTNWIKDNVLKNMIHRGTWVSKSSEKMEFGNRNQISNKLIQWLSKYKEEGIQFVSDVGHYDMVLLIDLLADGADAFSVPDWIPPVYYDINQEIAKYYNISQFEAFNKSREDILKETGNTIIGVKHNSLYDAKVIKNIYHMING